jgi:hypothetical protein
MVVDKVEAEAADNRQAAILTGSDRPVSSVHALVQLNLLDPGHQDAWLSLLHGGTDVGAGAFSNVGAPFARRKSCLARSVQSGI